MTVLAATMTAVAILSYLAAIACAMAFFLLSLTRYLRNTSRFEAFLLTFSAALLIIFIGGGFLWFRFLSVAA